MTKNGGCYCGELTYEVTIDPLMKGQCHCRECQYISGGGPNYFMAIAAEGFKFTSGTPVRYQRDDLTDAVTRAFCGTCGTQISTTRPDFDGVILKVGTLDDPSVFYAARVAIFTKDKQEFHYIPDECLSFDGPTPR